MTILPLRDASRRLVRELGFLRRTLAGTDLPASAVHALVEIGESGSMSAVELCERLNLEKSSVSRMVRKLVEAGLLGEEPDAADGRTKGLSLTAKGRTTLDTIHRFANEQVQGALALLPGEEHGTVLAGIARYAEALRALRTGTSLPRVADVTIEAGYRPGIIGRCAAMHGRYYSRTVGFGWFFEAKVAAGMAEFAARLDRPGNQVWSAVRAGEIVGTIAIDGEDLGTGNAHLRWFILDDGMRGGGIGRRLLGEALDFCDRQGFPAVELWTFAGLDAARRLYESFGFVLVEEWRGTQWGDAVMEQRFIRRAGAALD